MGTFFGASPSGAAVLRGLNLFGFELLTRFDTGQRCKQSFRMTSDAQPLAEAALAAGTISGRMLYLVVDGSEDGASPALRGSCLVTE